MDMGCHSTRFRNWVMQIDLKLAVVVIPHPYPMLVSSPKGRFPAHCLRDTTLQAPQMSTLNGIRFVIVSFLMMDAAETSGDG
jgi:hypothetical protein